MVRFIYRIKGGKKEKMFCCIRGGGGGGGGGGRKRYKNFRRITFHAEIRNSYF